MLYEVITLLEMGERPSRAAVEYETRSIAGGFLRQEIDRGDPYGTEWKVVSRRAPTEAELAALRFAWKACVSAKSNAILLAAPIDASDPSAGYATVGIGSGQPNRVDSTRIAAERAGDRAVITSYSIHYTKLYELRRPGPALRREPAPEGLALYRRAGRRAPGRSGTPGQGAVLQQPARPGRRLADGRRLRRDGRGRRQAPVALRRRDDGRSVAGQGARGGHSLRPAVGLRRRRRGQPGLRRRRRARARRLV